jgi:hypothetical protein
MLRTVVRWIALVSTCIPLAAATAHVVELPNKFTLDGPLWLGVQQHLYRGWGPLFGPFEVVAVLSAWLLVILLREQRPVFPLASIAALCLTGMIAAFFAFNAPVNAAVAQWSAETMPADWPAYRLRWELGHAIAFVLGLAALIALIRAGVVAEAAASSQRQTAGRRVVPLSVIVNRSRAVRSRGVVSLRRARE